MKKITLFTLLLAVVSPIFAFAQAPTVELSAQEKAASEIIMQLDEIITSGNVEKLSTIIKDNEEKELTPLADLTEFLDGKSIKIKQEIQNINVLFADKIIVNTAANVEGSRGTKTWEFWEVPTYYEMHQQTDGSWMITDTDIISTINSDSYAWAIYLFGIAMILCILLFVFWIWTIVDLFKRDYTDNKALWIVLIVVFGIIGSIAYYFGPRRTARRKHKTTHHHNN